MEDAIRMTDDQAGIDPVADASTVVPPSSAPEDLTGLRLALHRNGYRPVPVLGAHVTVKGAGKRPMMKGWETVCASADEAEIARWTKAQRNCTNPGLLCGELVGVDIDVLDRDHAHRLTCIATEMLGMSPGSRIGRAPKILLAFRTDAPFDKVQTSEFHMLDGTVARVEVLATGQQFVSFGIHPDTKALYQRGSMVVRPAMVPAAIADGRKIDAPRLVDVKAHHMAEAFTRAANCKRFDKREGKWLQTDCPHKIAETFLVREGQWPDGSHRQPPLADPAA
jgi:Bifunctional DNA primase/polymerase, N-terminal